MKLQALILFVFIDQNGLQAQPLRPEVSNHSGAGEDATNQPEDATKRLQSLILSVFINQNGLQGEPTTGGKRGCLLFCCCSDAAG